ncbi:unnamed protein product [Durusdinium trenchii]|uniref:Uncharacterized protein n=1 Tax=Durusdinium trenchii TaxID=1381693 RepID=A0ABP0K041_9DINO
MKGRRPPPDWGEGVLDSIGLGLGSVPHEHDAPEANASQIKEETLNLPPDDLHDFQLPEGALDAATDASLPAPPTPLPSPMLEVPPTPAEDFRSSWASPASPMASPMASPAVPSPLWQPLDASASPDALHPLPSPVLRSPRGLRIIRRPEASPKRLPQGGPQSASEPSRQPSHPPSDPLGPQSGGDQAPKANETNEKPD